MAYSTDLRERVVRTHAQTGSSAEAAEQHHCSESWVRRMTQLLRDTGSLDPKSTARTDDQRAYDDKDEAKIRKLIKQKTDATLAKVTEAIGKPASQGTVSRNLQLLYMPRQ